MDPITIDLTSVAGIVLLTMTIIHWAKGWIGGLPYLQKVPVSAYVVLVSGGLTLLAHDGLGVLTGDRFALLQQAMIQALAASGAIEWWRAGSKPVEESDRARAAESRRVYLLPLLLAIGLSASVGCADKTRAIAVQADATIYTILESVQTGADQLVASGQITPATRAALAPYLLQALKLGDNYNRAVKAGVSFTALSELLDALRTLKIQVSTLIPSAFGGSLVAQVERAIGLVPAP